MATRSSCQSKMAFASMDTKSDGAPPSSHYDVQERSQSSTVREFLRFFKLQVLAWRAPSERRKIAMHHSRPIATYHILLHVVPLGGAVSLLYLSWSSVFVGPEFSNTAALQFAAKIHELLMQASIGEVVLAIIHTQMMTGFIPLGALSTSMRASHLSSIWSLDFMSAVTSRDFVGWRKLLFATLIPILILLISLVGPASAVLMIPRLGASSTIRSTTLYADAPAASLFPTRVNSERAMDFDLERSEALYPSLSSLCSLGHSGHYDGSVYNTDSRATQRLMHISTTERADDTADNPESNVSHSTTAAMAVPLTSIAITYFGTPDAYPSSPWPRNATISARIPHPVVVTRCTWNKFPAHTLSDTMVTYIQDDGISQGNLSSVGELIGTYLRQGGSTDTNMSSIPPIWSQSPEPNSSALIGTFFSFDDLRCERSNLTYLSTISELFAEGYRNTTQDCLEFRTCSIFSFWATSTNKVENMDGIPVMQTEPFPDSGFKKVVYGDAITMDLFDSPSFNNPNLSRYSVEVCFEPILAAAFVTALANLVTPSFLDTEPISLESTSFDYTLIQYGYGYEPSPNSVRLSLAVITTYCIIATGYLVYIFLTGHTSTAWNSAIELVLLALQSKQPDHLGHTSVGVESLETLRQAVGIRVNDEEELELVFAHDRDVDTRGMRKIVPNKAY